MDESVLDKIFSALSKVIIVVPIVVVVVALFLKFNQSVPSKSKQKTNDISVIPTLKPVQNQALRVTGSPFNLTGPLFCTVKTEESTVSAYIKDKKVLVNNVGKDMTNHILLSGDCVYNWEAGKYSGEKLCGVGQYVNLFTQFSQFGLVGTNSISSMIEQFGGSAKLGSREADLKNLLNACQTKEIEDMKIFEVPGNVLFRNKSVK